MMLQSHATRMPDTEKGEQKKPERLLMLGQVRVQLLRFSRATIHFAHVGTSETMTKKSPTQMRWTLCIRKGLFATSSYKRHCAKSQNGHRRGLRHDVIMHRTRESAGSEQRSRKRHCTRARVSGEQR